MKKLLAAAILLGGTMVSTAAMASHLTDTPPPADLIVTRGALQWVWAAPCPVEEPSCGGTVVLHDGFRYATDDEWLASFTDRADLLAAFDISPGGPVRCASPYFSVGWDNCDRGDIATYGLIWDSPLADAAGMAEYAYFAETFLVRDGRVPEPGMLGLLGLGVLGLGAARRRRTA